MKFKIKAIAGILKKYGYNSVLLRNYIAILITIIAITILVYSSIFYNIQKLFENEVAGSNYESLLRVQNTVDGIFKDAKNMAEYLCVNEMTQLLIISNKNDYVINDLTNKIQDLIKSYMLVNQYLYSITVYSANNDIVLTDKGMTIESGSLNWYDDDMSNRENGINIFYSPQIYNIPNTICVEKEITLNLDSQKKKLGTIRINIDAQKLRQYIYNEKETQLHDVIILNNDNYMIYSNNPKLIGSKFETVLNYDNNSFNDGDKINIGNKKYEIRSVRSESNNFKYVSIVDAYRYLDKLNIIKQATLFSMVIFVLLGAVVSIYIATSFFKPLQSIMDILENDDISKSDVHSILKRLKNNEIKYIISSISSTIYSKNEVEDELKRRLLMLQKSQIGALQAQINPHFLYNTLNMLSWRAIADDNKNLSEAIVNLSELFRISLDMENHTIPIAGEMVHAKLYIDIAKMRYENEFETIWNIPDDILDSKIVKICFQPIIENAISHGIKVKNEKGLININAYKIDDDILIEIEDNGIGMDAEEVNDLNKKFNEEYLMSDDCIGLRNINLRLRLIYGENYHLKVESVKGQGTKVIIRIPNTSSDSKKVD